MNNDIGRLRLLLYPAVALVIFAVRAIDLYLVPRPLTDDIAVWTAAELVIAAVFIEIVLAVFRRKLADVSVKYLDALRQTEQISALHDLARAMNSTLEARELVKLVVERLPGSPNETKAFALINSQHTATVVAAAGPQREAVVGLEVNVESLRPFTLESLVQTRGPVIISDARTIDHPLYASFKERFPVLVEFRSLVIVPAMAMDELIGFLAVGSPSPMEHDEGELRMLSTFATQTAIAIERARLYSSANERATQLAEINDFKNNLLSAIFHELRTPLASLKTSAELLLEEWGAEAGRDAHRRLLANLARSVERIDRLLSDLFEMTNLQNAKVVLNVDKYDLGQLIGDALAPIMPFIERKQQHLDVQIPNLLPQIVVDRRRFEQVLANLLVNATKFSPEGANVWLKAWQEGGNVVFEVGDDGPGILKEEQERIFEPFYRGMDHAGHKVAGSGLGLSIVKSLVELHGGKIWLQSEPSHGSRFLFSLPLDGPSENTCH